jgi:hypothetical protein
MRRGIGEFSPERMMDDECRIFLKDTMKMRFQLGFGLFRASSMLNVDGIEIFRTGGTSPLEAMRK